MNFHGHSIQAALFDMDGTMFDTERLRFQTLKQASRELFGEAIDDQVLLGSLGLSARKAEALAKSRYGAHYPYAEIRARADELELAHVRARGVPVKAGLYEVLERLKKSGLRLAVATSSRRAIAEEYLINANVLKYFDATVCGDEVGQGKPHPEIFQTAAAALGCAPSRCLVFEDSENGLLSGAASGGLPILLKDIKEPAPEIKAKALRAYEGLDEFLADLTPCTPLLPVPALTDPFPQTHNEHIAAIHGFGAIGGGYLAQLFAHWDGYTRPAEIVGVTNNRLLRDLVNAYGKYSVHYPEQAFEQTIDRVRLIAADDRAAVIALYEQAEIVGLSLPEGAIAQQAGLIADGLIARWRSRRGPLTLLVTLNKVGGAAYVRRCVAQALERRLAGDEAARVLASATFAETVVNRIVSRVPREALLKQVRIKVGSFSAVVPCGGFEAPPQAPGALAVDSLVHLLSEAAQLDRALETLSIVLFHSGPEMALYAERGGAILERLRQVRTVDDIAEIQAIKNKMLNGTHAIIGWYSALLGYRTIGQGMGDERVRCLVRRLLEQEIKPAMLAHNPALQTHIEAFVGRFIKRCEESFKDACTRVGRDPRRKLQRKERILGNIELAARHGISTPMLEFGTALGIVYALRYTGTEDKECLWVREAYARRGSVADVLTDAGPYQGRVYAGLDALADRALIARIASHVERLRDPASPHWDYPLAPRVPKPARRAAGTV